MRNSQKREMLEILIYEADHSFMAIWIITCQNEKHF